LVVQEAFGDDVMALGVVHLLEVHPQHHVGVRRLVASGGGGDHDLASSCLQVPGGAGAGAELAGRLDHELHAKLTPRQLVRTALGQHAHLTVIDDDRPILGAHGPGEPSVDGVEREQLR
jgi:hypothetical protein